MRCPECGGEYDDSFAFCPFCGRREVPPTAPPPGGQVTERQALLQKKRDPSGERTILIVDDDEMFVKLMSTNLRLSGYKVIAALDGEQAVMITHRMMPDVILMDIAMPGLTGISAIEKIKQSRLIRHIPIIVISAFLQKDYIQKAREAGVEEYMAKPLDPAEVVSAIEKALRSKAQDTAELGSG